MTVQELIAALAVLPPDLPIWISCGDPYDSFCDDVGVELSDAQYTFEDETGELQSERRPCVWVGAVSDD